MGLKLIHVSKRAPDIVVPNGTRLSSAMTACTMVGILRWLSRFNITVWQPANVIHNGWRNHQQSSIPVSNTSACRAQIWSSLSLQISAPRVVRLVANKALQCMQGYHTLWPMAMASVYIYMQCFPIPDHMFSTESITILPSEGKHGFHMVWRDLSFAK